MRSRRAGIGSAVAAAGMLLLAACGGQGTAASPPASSARPPAAVAAQSPEIRPLDAADTQEEGPAGADTNDVGSAPGGGFVVSEDAFDRMFPDRTPFYTYQGLVTALGSAPSFARTGDDTARKQEAAAFLANVAHETGGLQLVVEQDTAAYPSYCDASLPFGCPAGQAAYFGRGPLQLTHNDNYKSAGDALGVDLLDHPELVQDDPAVAWATALWFWETQTGAGTATAHDAMVAGSGFGATVRSINGALECDGNNPAQVQDRVDRYQEFASVLGVAPGDGLGC